MLVLVSSVTTHVTLVLIGIPVLLVQILKTELWMKMVNVSAKMDIMMPESLIVKNVTSNVKHVMMDHVVLNVPETD